MQCARTQLEPLYVRLRDSFASVTMLLNAQCSPLTTDRPSATIATPRVRADIASVQFETEHILPESSNLSSDRISPKPVSRMQSACEACWALTS
jgi:hypothetical protein